MAAVPPGVGILSMTNLKTEVRSWSKHVGLIAIHETLVIDPPRNAPKHGLRK